jgi:hypothetical protein
MKAHRVSCSLLNSCSWFGSLSTFRFSDFARRTFLIDHERVTHSRLKDEKTEDPEKNTKENRMGSRNRERTKPNQTNRNETKPKKRRKETQATRKRLTASRLSSNMIMKRSSLAEDVRFDDGRHHYCRCRRCCGCCCYRATSVCSR